MGIHNIELLTSTNDKGEIKMEGTPETVEETVTETETVTEEETVEEETTPSSE